MVRFTWIRHQILIEYQFKFQKNKAEIKNKQQNTNINIIISQVININIE